MSLAIDYREVSVEQTSFTHLKNIIDEINEKGCFQPMILFDYTFLLDWHINLAVLCHLSAMLNVAQHSYSFSLSPILSILHTRT